MIWGGNRKFCPRGWPAVQSEKNGMPRVPWDVLCIVGVLEMAPMTEKQLIVALNMRPSVLRRRIEELLGLDLVHIAAYRRERGNSQLVATYAAGSKVQPSARRRRPKNVERLGTSAR